MYGCGSSGLPAMVHLQLATEPVLQNLYKFVVLVVVVILVPSPSSLLPPMLDLSDLSYTKAMDYITTIPFNP